jgi:hypothetical protein
VLQAQHCNAAEVQLEVEVDIKLMLIQVLCPILCYKLET